MIRGPLSNWSENLFLWIFASLAISLPAHAHKVVTSVWADGEIIEGEIGFSNGNAPPQGTRLDVLGPGGENLGEVSTDTDGLFRFRPTKVVAHTFRGNLGSGHVGEATLGIDDLPVSLVRDTSATESTGVNAVAGTAEPAAGLPADKDLEFMIAEAVQRQIRPLRNDLAAYKEKNDMQSILGGIGYICGIFGLLFFFYARREKPGA